MALEQFLNWHHSHSQASSERQPLTYLILIADAVHNLVGGLFVGASFLMDFRLGIVAWLASAAHEVPQEVGDFEVLIQGGRKKSSALIYNSISALTFLAGEVVAYFASAQIDVVFPIPLQRGIFYTSALRI